MPRVLAIDFGLKRTGLAVTDTLRIIASALETVETKSLIEYLKKYVAREHVDGFVVGLPVNLNGTATDATRHVQAFVLELRKHLPNHWIETVDERFTSTMAKQTLLDSGARKMDRRDKGTLDRISATILLQGWLQQGEKRR